MEALNYVLGKRLRAPQATVWISPKSEQRKYPICFQLPFLFNLIQLLLGVPESLESPNRDREHKVQVPEELSKKRKGPSRAGQRMQGGRG